MTRYNDDEMRRNVNELLWGTRATGSNVQLPRSFSKKPPFENLEKILAGSLKIGRSTHLTKG